MYFKDTKSSSLVSSVNKHGIAVLKNYLSNGIIETIKSKIPHMLNNLSLIKTPSNILEVKKNNFKNDNFYWLPKKFNKIFEGNQFKQPTGEISAKVSKSIMQKGYKYYSKYTNSVEFKDPLIHFPEIQKIVFNEKIIDFAKKFLKTDPYLGYVAVRCHFKNNLPGIDFNLFHTDGRNKRTKPENKLLKLLVPFHLENKQKIEFNIIDLKRNSIKNRDYYRYQYSKTSELPKYLKKKNCKTKSI